MIQIDIDMPINCATCPFTRAINTYSLDSMCVLTKKKANEIRHREEWCPLKELVRCKDCETINENGWCEFINGYVHDGFCAWGKRKGGEEE